MAQGRLKAHVQAGWKCRMKGMYVVLFPILLALAVCHAIQARAGTSEPLLIEAELMLAEQPKNYFMVDLHERRISIKARGVVLREWEIEHVRFMGDPIPINPVFLIKKASCRPPKRADIQPESITQEGEFQLEALGVRDMPMTYTLVFDTGVSLYVRPRQKGPFSILSRAIFALKWHAVLPLRMLSCSCNKNTFSAIDIILKDGHETQALFWAFPEGTGCILTIEPPA